MACCRQDWWRTFLSYRLAVLFFFVAAIGTSSLRCARQPHGSLPQTAELSAGMLVSRLQQIDRVVQRAIDDGDIPGAVVLVGRSDRVVFCRAYGQSRQLPTPAPMRTDLRFDLASLTKPVATATSVLLLIERGDLRLTDRVSDYVPNFSRIFLPDGSPGEEARIQHLLTHTSGLPAYTSCQSAADSLGQPCSTADLVHYIAALPKEYAPGERTLYSCLGYITLGYIIEKISGKNLDQFSHEHVFAPLGMLNTGFVPADSIRYFCVPTEMVGDTALQGVVHDPLARLQGGISGNAGLFSTAQDLWRFARMVLNGGELDSQRVLSPMTINRMVKTSGASHLSPRGLGWVVKQGTSWVGGDLFPDGGYGHTGYTGTSLWIDPTSETAVIVLTNRVHPQDDGSVDWLRSSIANIVAAAIVPFDFE